MKKIIQIELKIKKLWGYKKAEKARAEKTTPMNMISRWHIIKIYEYRRWKFKEYRKKRWNKQLYQVVNGGGRMGE